LLLSAMKAYVYSTCATVALKMASLISTVEAEPEGNGRLVQTVVIMQSKAVPQLQ